MGDTEPIVFELQVGVVYSSTALSSEDGSEFLGEAVTVPTCKAVTVPAYKMVETSFPVIMPDPSGKPVAGELYTVDDATLARLDQLERDPLYEQANERGELDWRAC